MKEAHKNKQAKMYVSETRRGGVGSEQVESGVNEERANGAH
jgi:hypothetical protein